MKKLFFVALILIPVQVFAQITLLKTIDLEYPIARIVHFPNCGDSPLYLCKKEGNTYVVVNDGITFPLMADENLLFADHYHLYTTRYSENNILLRKYEEKDKGYELLKELSLPKLVNGQHYYLDIEMTDDHLFYFAHQPATSTKSRQSSIDFYNGELNKAFSVNEEFGVYNIHCFGLDSILFLKENLYENTLKTHLYDHNGKMLSDESFKLSFKPNTQASITDFLRNEGVIFTLVQLDTPNTHVMKFDHKGKLMWDDKFAGRYYGFLEFDDQLITYGGGDFNNPKYKLLFIDENKGGVKKDVDLQDHFIDFVSHKKLNAADCSFVPFGLNVNPEHTWISFVMSIYGVNNVTVNADRIMVFHGHHKVQVLDIELQGTEHPKVVPTDNNHLIVGTGKKVLIYKVQ